MSLLSSLKKTANGLVATFKDGSQVPIYPLRHKSTTVAARTTAGSDTYVLRGLVVGNSYQVSFGSIIRRDADASAAYMALMDDSNTMLYVGLLEGSTVTEGQDRVGAAGTWTFKCQAGVVYSILVSVVGTARVEGPRVSIVDLGKVEDFNFTLA